MTIKIEVTGESIAEVADKLLAIGGSLQGRAITTAPSEDTPEKPAEKPKPAPKPKAVKEAPKEDVGEPAPTATEAASTKTEKSEESPATASPAATEVPDYDSVVSPLVLETVKRVGRDPVVALISEFGAAKAAEIPDNQLADFVSRLNDL